MSSSMWDQRFSEPGYAYGTQENTFLRDQVQRIPKGRVLSLAEGEGRNAAFLASCGHDVTAVDASPVGLAKARRLARQRGVEIHTVLADLEDFRINESTWHGIVSIFCHLPPKLRRQVHSRCADGLTPGGVFVLEGFSPRQLELKTGGPRDPELLVEGETLAQELSGLEILLSREIERPIEEGKYHGGIASVVQLVAARPV